MVEGCDAHRLVQVTRKVLDSPCPFDNVRYFKKNENISFFIGFTCTKEICRSISLSQGGPARSQESPRSRRARGARPTSHPYSCD